MESFEEYGCVVFLEIGKELAAVARLNDVGSGRERTDGSCASLVVGHLVAVLLEFRCGLTSVSEGM